MASTLESLTAVQHKRTEKTHRSRQCRQTTPLRPAPNLCLQGERRRNASPEAKTALPYCEGLSAHHTAPASCGKEKECVHEARPKQGDSLASLCNGADMVADYARRRFH
ncbi:hypothetical protein HPB50_005444 [Hyalomma asiaticum]|uniref:Uncharacterized protein n=1 Tax=Hyalomma asiaticum TaxID=266040 RepID=A0ACB7SV75_HYAAI|nr:hypothetical protein HPB50_005444 [Hyalomma asiaticum]